MNRIIRHCLWLHSDTEFTNLFLFAIKTEVFAERWVGYGWWGGYNILLCFTRRRDKSWRACWNYSTEIITQNTASTPDYSVIFFIAKGRLWMHFIVEMINCWPHLPENLEELSDGWLVWECGSQQKLSLHMDITWRHGPWKIPCLGLFIVSITIAMQIFGRIIIIGPSSCSQQ